MKWKWNGMKVGKLLLHNTDLQGTWRPREWLNYIQLMPQAQWTPPQASLEINDNHITGSPVIMKELCIFISKKDYDGLWEGPLNDSCFFLSKKNETKKSGR